MAGANEILCRMRLDLDGILEVAAVEKRTGKSKQITIANALAAKSPEEIAAGRKRIQELFASRSAEFDEGRRRPSKRITRRLRPEERDHRRGICRGSCLPGEAEAADLMERSRKLLDKHAPGRSRRSHRPA